MSLAALAPSYDIHPYSLIYLKYLERPSPAVIIPRIHHLILPRSQTSLKATKAIIMEQNKVPGSWPCDSHSHCSVSSAPGAASTVGSNEVSTYDRFLELYLRWHQC